MSENASQVLQFIDDRRGDLEKTRDVLSAQLDGFKEHGIPMDFDSGIECGMTAWKLRDAIARLTVYQKCSDILTSRKPVSLDVMEAFLNEAAGNCAEMLSVMGATGAGDLERFAIGAALSECFYSLARIDTERKITGILDALRRRGYTQRDSA